MALMVNPEEAYENIRYLKAEGLEGPYGFYEAADYTPERMNFQSRKVIIKSFMAHHEGMSLLALNNYLHNNIMQARFHLGSGSEGPPDSCFRKKYLTISCLQRITRKRSPYQKQRFTGIRARTENIRRRILNFRRLMSSPTAIIR